MRMYASTLLFCSYPRMKIKTNMSPNAIRLKVTQFFKSFVETLAHSCSLITFIGSA